MGDKKDSDENTSWPGIMHKYSVINSKSVLHQCANNCDILSYTSKVGAFAFLVFCVSI